MDGLLGFREEAKIGSSLYRKGGSFDLEDLIIRRLTQEHIRELMEAWMDWPFRPSFEEIMSRSGTPLVHDELEDPLEFTGAPLPNL